MASEIQTKAQQILAEVEQVSAAILPEPAEATAIVPLEQADPQASAEIQRRMAEILPLLADKLIYLEANDGYPAHKKVTFI